jgi:hypothetical protein
MIPKFFAGLSVCCLGLLGRADQVIMQNGDRYHGTVVSVTTNSLVFQSGALGTVNLSRSQVTQITLGSNAVTRPQIQLNPATAPLKTNPTVPLDAVLLQLKNQPQLIQQVQNQYLSDATPEAKAKFDQMLSDLSTGKLSMSDLRAEAKSTADQLRSFRKELGDDAGEGLDGYLAILDNFVRASAPISPPTSNALVLPQAPLQPVAEKK